MTAPVANFDKITTLDGVKALADALLTKGAPVAFDIETGYSGPDTEGKSLNVYSEDQFTVGFSITNDLRWTRYVPLLHDFGDQNVDPEKVWPIMKPVLEELTVLCHNLAFEARNMLALERKGHGPRIVINPKTARDTMIQSFVLSETKLHRLKALTKLRYNYDQVEIDTLFGENLTKKQKDCIRFNVLPVSPEAVNYACDDSLWTLRLDQDQSPVVNKERKFIYDLDMEISSVLVDMTEVGISVEWDGIEHHEALFEKFYQKMEDRTRQLFEESAGRDLTTLNFRSHLQMRQLLFQDLGLTPTRKTKKTENGGGQASTSEAALEALRKQHPAVEQLLMYRQTKKMGEWFELWSKLRHASYDGKVHPSLNQVRIQSGRFASSEPNVQNIRKDWFFTTRSEDDFPEIDNIADAEERHNAFVKAVQEEGEQGTDYWSGNARKFIIASPGYTMLTFDYSQQELRVLAGLAKEPYLIDAFKNKIDIHEATAAMMFKIPVEKVTKDQRQRAKTVNFGLIYGQQAKALGEQLGISQQEAQDLIDLYFSSFSKVDAWFEKQRRDGVRKGYTESFMGRKSTVWDLQSENRSVRSKADRMFVNLVVQGGGADITKVAMVRCKRELVKRGWWMTKVRLLMNQHDSLVFEVSDDMDLAEVKEILHPLVSFPIEGFPEFAVDWEYGSSWGGSVKWGKPLWDKPAAPVIDVKDDVLELIEERVQVVFDQMPTPEIARSVIEVISKHPGESEISFSVGEQRVPLKNTVYNCSALAEDIANASGGLAKVKLERLVDAG